MRPRFRQKFQLSRIFKKMFRRRGLVRSRFRQKFQLSGIFGISKKVRNTIFTCTKKLMFPGYLFFKIFEKNFMECLLYSSSTLETLINLFAFLFYTLSLLKYYSKLHRLKTCPWWEFTQKTLCFCCSLKEFHGLTKYVVPPSMKHRTSKNQLIKQKQANINNKSNYVHSACKDF